MSYNFIARIELYEPDENCYDDLHEAMEAIGFEKTIVSDDGIEYHLPHAEYRLKVDLERTDIMNHIKIAVSNVTSNFRVLLTGREGMSWYNLKPVED